MTVRFTVKNADPLGIEKYGRFDFSPCKQQVLAEIPQNHWVHNTHAKVTPIRSLPCLVSQSVSHWPFLILFQFLDLLLHGFVRSVIWICQSCSMLFTPIAKQNQADV